MKMAIQNIVHFIKRNKFYILKTFSYEILINY